MSLSIHYDSTFNGFLSAVFEIYRQHLDVGGFFPERSYEGGAVPAEDLFMVPFHVETNEESARRLRRAIVNAASEDVLGVLDAAFRSEESGIEMKLLAYLRRLFAGIEPNYGKNPTSKEMLPLLQIAKSVNHERGNMCGMVRFEKTPDDMYIAQIEPKYNIVDLLAGHFQGRFPNGRWAVIDVKRGFGVFYDGAKVHFVASPSPEVLKEIAQSDNVTRMWKSYYDSMAIKERLNPKLLKQLLPVRYWKHLPERQTDFYKLSIGGNSSFSMSIPP